METKLLAELLDCSYGDIAKLFELANDFEVEIESLGIKQIIDDGGTFNDILEALFQDAISRTGIEPERTGTFTNYMDSHIYVDNENIYSFEQLKELADKEHA